MSQISGKIMISGLSGITWDSCSSRYVSQYETVEEIDRGTLALSES
jgi:hypothetical protein